MRLLIVVAFSLFGPAVMADTLAVLSKNQVAVLHPSGAISGVVENRSHQIFLTALGNRAKPGEYEAELPILPPPEWGKVVEKSGGAVHYQRAFAQGFVARLTLHHLVPKHVYVLTLNGVPQQAGNDRLPDPVPGLPEERFYDFLRFVTDEQGSYEADVGVYLLPGDYHVRIYVKDTADFKIVLYRDYFDFSVTPEAKPSPSTSAPARVAPKAP